MPGFTQISMFPKMCAEFGLDFTALTELLMKEAVSKFEAAGKLNCGEPPLAHR